MIQGIYTPNLVPFRADERINEDELRRMVNWLIKIACILADCGFGEAAGACRRPGQPAIGSRPAISAVDVDGLVREVMVRLQTSAARPPR